MKPNISLVFPCYNEEGNVARMIDDALAILPRLGSRFEIVVSDDGSTDRTRLIAESYATRQPDVVRVVGEYPNRGYGHALRTGLRAAHYEWVFFTDGDCQFVLAEMERLTPFLTDHDIVTGYRRTRRDPLYRKLNAAGWNLLGRVFLGVTVKDVNCAFRFYRKTFLEAIRIESNGAMVNMEIYAKARCLGLKIKEVEVTHLPRVSGKATGAKPKVVIKAFGEFFSLYGSLRAGRSRPKALAQLALRRSLGVDASSERERATAASEVRLAADGSHP